MLQITLHPRGSVILLKAQPGAKRNGIAGLVGTALKVTVTAPPEDGRANDAIIDLLREVFQRKRAEVELLSGATNRNKSILICGRTPEEIRQILQPYLT